MTVNADVLNSKHFGVPQNRERFFIVAWHRNKLKLKPSIFLMD